uniref:Probable E3 ubiquitin-protein ligase TRIM8-like n=1 Tax=Saccoglossus kowalevskii TaxID=10224 RepID=A0ABM0MPL4_SACKO|nr:PREDICTED: probable E3 ubiquitin-protein ligase TRIM8-like [Saccoglossus kowalevskii]
MAAKMSDSLLLQQISDEHLTCPICMERFKDARVLPCQHHFCFNCLVQVSGGDRTLKCPTCRKLHLLPSSSGIASLPKNYQMNGLAELLENREHGNVTNEDTLSCDACEETIAGNRCVECSSFLCHPCSNTHRKVKLTETHMQMTLDEYMLAIIGNGTVALETCKHHIGAPSSFHCNTCGIAVCVKCVVMRHGHPPHQCFPLQKTTDYLSTKIRSTESTLLDRLHDISDKKSNVEVLTKKVASVYDSQKNQIALDLEKKKTLIRETMNEIIHHLEKDAEAKAKYLDAEHQETCDVMHRELTQIELAEEGIIQNLSMARELSEKVKNYRHVSVEESFTTIDKVVACETKFRSERESEATNNNPIVGHSVRETSQRTESSPTFTLTKDLLLPGKTLRYSGFMSDGTVQHTMQQVKTKQYSLGRFHPRSILSLSNPPPKESCVLQ